MLNEQIKPISIDIFRWQISLSKTSITNYSERKERKEQKLSLLGIFMVFEQNFIPLFLGERHFFTIFIH
tara:strand:+ start:124 stop:330 length:207 start_codon:yes stop_codon:yes gene_type:complete